MSEVTSAETQTSEKTEVKLEEATSNSNKRAREEENEQNSNTAEKESEETERKTKAVRVEVKEENSNDEAPKEEKQEYKTEETVTEESKEEKNDEKAPITNASGPSKLVEVDSETLLEERGEVSAQYVGRVIGKGGEMIRDLQARSGCRIDVDQNVPEGAPRSILYRGTRKTIDFAKSLVAMLCSENGKEAELPLGEATRKILSVPANVIGKIIGRGGEMIRELQNKSQAKIQVDHTGNHSSEVSVRQVTLTGTELSVIKAEEMIHFLTSNPLLDANLALGMLLDEKSKHGSRWGSGPPYHSMPNGGTMMQAPQPQPQQHYYSQPYQQPQQQSYVNYQQPQQFQQSSTAPTETEVFPCAKIYMGRIIGQKGVTVNDLQNRSGCDIQINQDVPPGHDCQIILRGTRQGIDSAKAMLKEIIDLGPNHSYAGGRGHQQPQQQQQQQQAQDQNYRPAAATQYYYQYNAPPPMYAPPYQQQYYAPYPQQIQYQRVWKSATAADGQVYYYNEKTGETQWEKPPGF